VEGGTHRASGIQGCCSAAEQEEQEEQEEGRIGEAAS